MWTDHPTDILHTACHSFDIDQLLHLSRPILSPYCLNAILVSEQGVPPLFILKIKLHLLRRHLLQLSPPEKQFNRLEAALVWELLRQLRHHRSILLFQILLRYQGFGQVALGAVCESFFDVFVVANSGSVPLTCVIDTSGLVGALIALAACLNRAVQVILGSLSSSLQRMSWASS